ncbi:hypothetical protein PIROE2DRAFT_65539 [Piromyces sp. E2]|nr:hypothetical protein PIROE2DRAFT_65539 [Piromyces sp. E2]|eukprot:OUM56425.1 hypothetical protein PIROE2DRAFT_65539 [Piromyces sp. E2]
MDYAWAYDEKLNSEYISQKIKYYQTIFDSPVELLTIPRKETKLFKLNSLTKTHTNYKLNVIGWDSSTEFYNMVYYLTKKYNISKTSLFLIIYSLILSMYSGQNSIYNAIICSSRSNEIEENLIGLFARYMPVIVKIDKSMNLVELIKNYMDILFNIFMDDLPFSVVSKELNLPRCNSWFKFDPYELLNNDDVDIGLCIRPEDISDDSTFKKNVTRMKERDSDKSTGEFLIHNTNPDFICVVTEKKDSYNIEFTYNDGLYSESFIREMIFNFENILKNENNFTKNIGDLYNNKITLKNQRNIKMKSQNESHMKMNSQNESHMKMKSQNESHMKMNSQNESHMKMKSQNETQNKNNKVKNDKILEIVKKKFVKILNYFK